MMPSSLNCDTSEDKDHPFNLRFSGIPEADPDAQVVNTKEQVVDFLKKYLKVSVKPTEIPSARRLGIMKFGQDQPRTILCVLSNIWTIYNERMVLQDAKPVKAFINEDLSPEKKTSYLKPES